MWGHLSWSSDWGEETAPLRHLAPLPFAECTALRDRAHELKMFGIISCYSNLNSQKPLLPAPLSMFGIQSRCGNLCNQLNVISIWLSTAANKCGACLVEGEGGAGASDPDSAGADVDPLEWRNAANELLTNGLSGSCRPLRPPLTGACSGWTGSHAGSTSKMGQISC